MGGGGEALAGPSAARGISGGGGGGGAPSAGSLLIDGGGSCGGDSDTPTAGEHWFSETPAAGDEGCEGTGTGTAPLVPLSPLYLAEESGGRAGPSSSLPPTGSMPRSPEYREEEGASGRRSSHGVASAGPFPPVTISWPSSPAYPRHPADRQLMSTGIDGRSSRVTDMESCFFETAASCRPESPRGPREALGSGAVQQPHVVAASRPASSLSQEYSLLSADSTQPYPSTIGDVARSHSFLPRIPQPLPPQQCQQPTERPVTESVRPVASGAVSASWTMQQAMKAQVCTWGRGILPVLRTSLKDVGADQAEGNSAIACCTACASQALHFFSEYL